MSETEFAALVFLLGKELAAEDGLDWVEPFKTDCLDRATFVLDWLEDGGYLK